MKYLVSLLLGSAVALPILAATRPIYINDAPVQSPPDPLPHIDASIFVNRSQFSVSTGTDLPFETANTVQFTNTGSGVMFGSPGFRFNLITNTFRYPLRTFVNERNISSSTYLLVTATNLTSSGRMDSSDFGDIRLDGRNVNLARGSLRVGAAITPGTIFVGGGGRNSGTNYFNAANVTDVYWGEGRNNSLTNGPLMDLQLLTSPFAFGNGSFVLPAPFSPLHQVIQTFGTFLFTNLVQVNGGGFTGFRKSNYGAFVYTNQIGTNRVVQVVFAPTNDPNLNLSVQVRFAQPFSQTHFNPPRGRMAIVEFSTVDFDIVEQQSVTNYIYFLDSSVNFTNITLNRPFNLGTTRRPSTYELTRNTPFEFQLSPFFGSVLPNADYTPELLFNANSESNTVDTIYAGYSAQITTANSNANTTLTPTPIFFGVRDPALSDPTNFIGKVEIFSGSLNLNQTRIRAENFVGIRSTNLINNAFAQVDAPFINFDVRSTNSPLIVSNLAPPFVNRLSGELQAWSCVWENAETNITSTATNLDNVRYHVLILDTTLQAQQPALLHEFALHGGDLVIADNIVINKSVRLEADSIQVNREAGLAFPLGATFASTNIVKVLRFTNEGSVSINRSASFGSDRPQPYEHFINRGTLVGASVSIRTRNFENIGLEVNPAVLTSSGGVLSLDTVTGNLSNAFISADSDFTVKAGNLFIQNTRIRVGNTNAVGGQSLPGALAFTVTNSLTDGGPNSSNEWLVTGGFQVVNRPPSGDLIGTILTSRIRSFGEATHIWPGEDRGASPAGFNNNLALGKLTLDGQGANLFRFRGPTGGGQRAIYVDFLDFQNDATNYDNTLPNVSFSVAENFTIYYADASVDPLKLNGALNGRLRWVSDFVGPFSGTNVVYPSGRTYRFNAGLARSNDQDSDNDGVVNSQDPTPFFVPGEINEPTTLSILKSAGPPAEATLSWLTSARTTNTVEYKQSTRDAGWQKLTSFVNTTNGRVTVKDNISAPQRVYRVRIDSMRP